MEGLLPLRPALRRSLAASARWFNSMIDGATHRLHYAFQNGQHVDRSCPVRDIGTAADLAVLSAATGSHEFDEVGTARRADHGEEAGQALVCRAASTRRGAAHQLAPASHLIMMCCCLPFPDKYPLPFTLALPSLQVIGTTLQHYESLLVRHPLPQGTSW